MAIFNSYVSLPEGNMGLFFGNIFQDEGTYSNGNDNYENSWEHNGKGVVILCGRPNNHMGFLGDDGHFIGIIGNCKW